MKAPGLALGAVRNTLSVGTSTVDPIPANNTASLVSWVLTAPRLAANRTHSIALTAVTGTTYQIE